MAELITFDDFKDYAKFNREFIATNPMLYYHLANTIKRVFRGQAALYKFFNIIDDNCFVSVILIEDECLIFGNNANEQVVTKLSEGLQFQLFKRYQFFGTRQIIDALFQRHSVVYDEQKHRIIYECRTVAPDFKYSPGQLTMADSERIHELAQFNIAFTNEYYDDIQPMQKAIQVIVSGIENSNLYQWNNGQTICAIAQSIHNEYDSPVIGHVFVNPSCRNNGYGASIVHRVTKGLLDVGHEKCLLTTNAYNPASNKAFKRVGYSQTGEYVVRYKKQ